MFLGIGKINGKTFLVESADTVAKSLQTNGNVNFYKVTVTPVMEDVVVGEDEEGNDVLKAEVVGQKVSLSDKLQIKPDSRVKVREVQSVALEDGSKIFDAAEVEV